MTRPSVPAPAGRSFVLLVFSAWLLAAPAPAAAQACDRSASVATPTEAADLVRTLVRDRCLGETACTSPVCRSLNALLAAASPTREQVAGGMQTILQTTRGATDLGADRDTLLTRMAVSLARYVDDGRTAAAAWTREDLTFFGDEPHEIDVEARLQSCSDAASCTAASTRAQHLIELATLFGRVLTKANEGSRNAFAAQLDLIDQQWRAYLGASRGQYPWELALNSVLYRKSAQFDAPPTSQWIFAHPGAAFELTSSTTDRQPSESLLLELFGIYRWSWNQEKMRQRFGGSATLSWRDAGEGRNKLGYGVLAYLPRWSSVGYVWRPQEDGDEHALVLSADLARFIRGTSGIKDRLIGARAGSTK